MSTTELSDDHFLILKAVSNGQNRWSLLSACGFHFGKVKACVRRGYLSEEQTYNYKMTDLGRDLLDSHAATPVPR